MVKAIFKEETNETAGGLSEFLNDILQWREQLNATKENKATTSEERLAPDVAEFLYDMILWNESHRSDTE